MYVCIYLYIRITMHASSIPLSLPYLRVCTLPPLFACLYSIQLEHLPHNCLMWEILIHWILNNLCILKLLVLCKSNSVTHRRQCQKYGHHKQTRNHQNTRTVLYNGHNKVKDAPRTIRLEPLNKLDKIVTQWADLQQEWNFNKQDNESLYDANYSKRDHCVHVK